MVTEERLRPLGVGGVAFGLANKVLFPSSHSYSERVGGVVPLAVWSDGEQCVSCWRLSLRERLSALVFGRVWVALLSGWTTAPAYIQARREYLKEGQDAAA